VTPENTAVGRSLARRVSGWTSNLLATGIVLAAAVGVGRQLTHWWRIEPDRSSTLHVEPPDSESQATFGGGYSLRRIEWKGDLESALARLRKECRAIAENGPALSRPVSESEQRFLSRTRARPPLEEQADRWQIHQFEGKLPLLVAVRLAKSGRDESRVVAWGLAMPTDEEACTLLVYEAGGTAEDHGPAGEVPLPTSLRRTLTLRSQGQTSIGLAGDVSPRRASSNLDEHLSSRGWTSTGWRQTGGAWHNRYRAAAGSLDVQLSDNGRGGVAGLLTSDF
jgi:hypothetical protein